MTIKLEDLRQYIPPSGGLDYKKTFRHVAVLVRRNKIISVAVNQIGSRSTGCGYSCFTIHAEANCIKKAGNIRKLNGSTMYVFRTGKGCNEEYFYNSKPCSICEKLLTKCMENYGLLRVFYSVSSDYEENKHTHTK
jgi:deoxycytidylate deaminase